MGKETPYDMLPVLDRFQDDLLDAFAIVIRDRSRDIDGRIKPVALGTIKDYFILTGRSINPDMVKAILRLDDLVLDDEVPQVKDNDNG